MSKTAFLYRMPAYGLFGAISNGKFVPLSPADTAASVYGLLTKPYPTSGVSNSFGEAQPPINGMANVMRRGYATVLLRAGVATLKGQVYVRINNPLPGRPIGSIEAVDGGADTIAITSCTFMSGADADGNVEIAYNI